MVRQVCCFAAEEGGSGALVANKSIAEGPIQNQADFPFPGQARQHAVRAGKAKARPKKPRRDGAVRRPSAAAQTGVSLSAGRRRDGVPAGGPGCGAGARPGQAAGRPRRWRHRAGGSWPLSSRPASTRSPPGSGSAGRSSAPPRCGWCRRWSGWRVCGRSRSGRSPAGWPPASAWPSPSGPSRSARPPSALSAGAPPRGPLPPAPGGCRGRRGRRSAGGCR